MRKAQSTLEYAVLVSCVVLALIATQTYMKRGIQGRLRSEADNLGEPYQPGSTTSVTTLQSNSRITTNTVTSKVGNVTQTITDSSTDYDTEHRVGSETVN